MTRLDTEHVLVLHSYAIAETGGAGGVRDEALLVALTFTDAELEALGLGVADGEIDTGDIQTWIENHKTDAV